MQGDKPAQRGRLTAVLNLLTVILLAATAALAAGFVVINVNPATAAGLLPPSAGVSASLADLPTPLVPLSAAEEDGAPAGPPSPTPEAPTATPTRSATSTRLPPTTPFATLVVISTSGPTPTPTWTRSPWPFTVQGDMPFAVENVFNLAGCNWLGIGGQVYDLRGGPLIGYVIHLDGGGLDANSLSGTQPQYGPAGYEFKLGSSPKRSSGIYRVQLRDPQNVPVSDWMAVDTFDDCTKNVLLVNFLQNH
jgi:hypothetical protein